MEYFEANLTYHDNEIAIEYPELTDGQYGLKACKDVKKWLIIYILLIKIHQIYCN